MILIFDIGKTNKKAFVFNESYQIVWAKSDTLPEMADEDGDPCEDLRLLRAWVLNTFEEVMADPRFKIRAVNVSAYGASLVHLDASGEPLAPLYNYLKPFPESLKQRFFQTYGDNGGEEGEEGAIRLLLDTASPDLGSLNSGLQLYRLKHEQPLLFNRIFSCLHLPQYLAFLISGIKSSEITSIGCHTLIWHFSQNEYHHWVIAEGLADLFPPIMDSWATKTANGLQAGIGLHDSSAALIPYLATFEEPFVLISTGTWCISLNPFNPEPLTDAELAEDCLCYLTYEGKPVKASRFFGGNIHEAEVKRLVEKHGVTVDFYQSEAIAPEALKADYVAFMGEFVEKQAHATRLAIGNTAVRRLFVDGGFSGNEYYLKALAAAFPEMEVYAAEVAQATALGAAMAIHAAWNKGPFAEKLISLKRYFPQ